MFFLSIDLGGHDRQPVQLWASKDREENFVLQDQKISETVRDKRKVTQGVKTFIVLWMEGDGKTEKIIPRFSSPPDMPKPSQSILNLLDNLKQLWLKITQLEGWDFSVLTCICGSATIKQIRIWIQRRVNLLRRVSVGWMREKAVLKESI